MVGWREGCFDWWSGIEEAIPFPVRCQRLNIHLAGEPEWLAQIPAFRELYAKIKRHKGHIRGTIRPGTGNARAEATNNKIKLAIRKAYGFRNIGNTMDMIYLVCLRHPHPAPQTESNHTKTCMATGVSSNPNPQECPKSQKK